MASRRSLSRKRTPSARGARARNVRILAAAGCAVILAVGIFLLRSSRWSLLPAKPAGDRDRVQIAARLRQALERAGGDGVWVKSPPFAPFPPAHAGTVVEALVAQSNYDTALSAFERQAAILGLQANSKVTNGREHLRLAEFRLTRGGALAGSWTVREVPRIRHAVVIIDDLGQDIAAARQLIEMPCPLTFAVLPHQAYSKATAEEAHRAGREVMLHLPMEPDSPARPGAGEIRVGMRREEIERLLDADLGSVPFVTGANNHMGSRATRDARLMTEVMDALERRRLFFIDSRTTPQSVALDVARRRGMPTFYRSVFLDDTESVPYTLGQLREFIRVLEDQDAAIAIGHPHPTTLAALAQFLPELERHAIRMVPASELLRRPEIARLTPRVTNGP